MDGIDGPWSFANCPIAQYWGVILASQVFWGIHVGIDNLNVLRGVAKILDQGTQSAPFSVHQRWRSSPVDLRKGLHSRL